ncbi:transmembrane protein 192-like [Sycon ciliatum]|uniref:transmembrane protein 192-like n=1 Tax=Sycon ciliatum TaxID=27933 RepID=UPI0020AD80AA|eukprot:scpid66899/ scgid25144/ Transmembrane protein 192
MVSLNANDRNFQGGFFLGDESQTDAESVAADHSLLTSSTSTFKPLKSFWVALVETLLITGYLAALIVAVAIPMESPTWPKSTTLADQLPFPFYVVMHAVLWLVVAASDRVVQIFHQQVRRRGYLDFYRRNRLLRRMPFVVLSAGNAVLLVLTQFKNCTTTDCSFSGMKWMEVLLILVSSEMLIALPCQVYYLVRVFKFNYSRPAPDVEEDLSLPYSTPWVDGGTEGDIGLREGDYLDEVLEKQADMIRYLQQHNANLARRIASSTTANPR